jgi:hypothetical protein
MSTGGLLETASGESEDGPRLNRHTKSILATAQGARHLACVCLVWYSMAFYIQQQVHCQICSASAHFVLSDSTSAMSLA